MVRENDLSIGFIAVVAALDGFPVAFAGNSLTASMFGFAPGRIPCNLHDNQPPIRYDVIRKLPNLVGSLTFIDLWPFQKIIVLVNLCSGEVLLLLAQVDKMAT